jgi:hypothetical protein
MSVKHNAYYIVTRLDAKGPAMEREVGAELDVQAQLVARTMRREAPTFQSVLVNSIHVEKPDVMQRLVAPGVDYAQAVHDGVKPGKGLPRFFDPEANDLVRWLESKVQPHTGKPRRGTGRFTAAELELRDRYQGLSWHVRLHGTQGNPFVERTVDAMANGVVAALKAAALRGLQGGNSTGAVA